jgi:hypothetical protein
MVSALLGSEKELVVAAAADGLKRNPPKGEASFGSFHRRCGEHFLAKCGLARPFVHVCRFPAPAFRTPDALHGITCAAQPAGKRAIN